LLWLIRGSDCRVGFLKRNGGFAAVTQTKALGQLVPKAGFGKASQQVFSAAVRRPKMASAATLALSAKTCKNQFGLPFQIRVGNALFSIALNQKS